MKFNSTHYFIKFLTSFFLLTIIQSSVLFAAPLPDTLWTKTFGGTNIDVGYSVQQTSDGGFVIGGYTRSYGTMSGRNVWLIKTDLFGNHQWNKTFGGNNDEECYSVQQTSDGGYVLAGYTKSFGAGLNDAYIIKTDTAGNEMWSKTFGGAQDDEGYSVWQTNDGGFVVAGATSSFGAGSRDMWLIKTNSAGSKVWEKTYGGLSSDGARSVSLTSDGGFIITGWTFSYGPGAVGNLWLVKTDSLGNQQWHKDFGGTDADRGYSVEQTNDGGYIITGYTASFGAGNDDLFLVKTDSLGNEMWKKTFGGTGRDYGNSVQQTRDNGYIIVGYTLSFGAGGDDVWLVKTNANGVAEWSKTLGGTASDVGNAVRETSDGGYILTGHTLSYGAGVHDVWLVRIASIIPVELVSFNASALGGNVLLKWITATELNNKGFEIERSQKPKIKGKTEWNKIGFIQGNGTTGEQRHYLFEDKNLPSGKYFYRLKQIDFNGSFEYSNEIGIEVSTPTSFSLEQNYPNPFNPSTRIKYTIPALTSFLSQRERMPEGQVRVMLKVYDVLGNEVATLVDEYKSAGSYEAGFNASKLSSGIYYYRLRAGDYIETKKMILLK